MSAQQINDEQLLDFLDGTLGEPDRKRIEEVLAESSALRARLIELQKIDAALHTLPVLHPSNSFTSRVLKRVQESGSVRSGLWLLGGILLVTTLATILVSSGVFNGTGIIDLNPFINVDNMRLPEIPINGRLIVNVIILLNIVLAFIVLDRAILRPWFENRIQKQ